MRSLEIDFLLMIRQHEGIIYKVATFYADADNVPEDRPQKEIAAILGITQSNVSTKIYRICCYARGLMEAIL